MADVKAGEPTSTRRMAGIEGLRGIAAASVLITHVWSQSQGDEPPFELGFVSDYLLPPTHHGVILFFALSGFLLWLPFAAAILNGPRLPNISAYLRNRALRIFPAYWFVLLFAGFVLQSARVSTETRAGGALTDPLLLLENLFLVQNYDAERVSTGIAASWSLTVELVFYLALPILGLACLRLARRAGTPVSLRAITMAPAALLGVLGLAGVGYATLRAADAETSVLRISFLTHAHLFALGMFLAVVVVEVREGRMKLPERWRPFVALGLVVLALTTLLASQGERLPERIEVLMVALCCVMLLALTALGDPRRSRLVKLLERPAFVGAGLVSYSVYLWHLPIIAWLHGHGVMKEDTGGAFVFNLVVVAAITYVLSVLTYRYVEKPALARKKSPTVTQTAHIPVGRDASPAPTTAAAPAPQSAAP